MARFKDLILTELGNTTDGYNFRLRPTSGHMVEFGFKSEQNTYRIQIDNELPGELSVSYSYKDENGDYVVGLTDEENQFRVIATVINAVKHAWENKEGYFEDPELIEKIGFFGVTRDDESVKGGTARTKLYLQFIKRQFPEAKIDKDAFGVNVYPKN